MAADVKLPGLGSVPRSSLMIGGLALVAVGGYAWYKKRQTSQSSTVPASADTGTTDMSGIDPATGVPYSEEYGYGGSYGAYGQTPSALGVYDPTTGQYFGTGVGVQTVTTVSTNAAWAQAAEQYLITLGFEPLTASAGIGKYLLGQPVTDAAQLEAVQAARAFENDPPTAGASGFPPAINTGPPAGQTGGSGSTMLAKVSGLHIISRTRTEIHVGWNAVPHATSYSIQEWTGGRMVSSWSVSGKTNAVGGSLRSGTPYTFYVTPHRDGFKSPSASSIVASTVR